MQTSGERTVGAMPSDRSSLVIRRHGKKATRLERKVRVMQCLGLVEK